MTCACGESQPHVIARRVTFDGCAVEIWHDGAITGRMGRKLPGVPIVRPCTAAAIELARRAASLVADELTIYEHTELPELVACARRVAARGGAPGALRTLVFGRLARQ